MYCRKWNSKKWYELLVNRLGGEISGLGPEALLLEWCPTFIQSFNRLLLPFPHRECFSLSYLKLFIQLSYQSCTHKCLHVALKVKTMSLQLRSLLLLLYCKSRSKTEFPLMKEWKPVNFTTDRSTRCRTNSKQWHFTKCDIQLSSQRSGGREIFCIRLLSYAT